MTGTPYDLASLLAPVPVEDFIGQYWGRRRLVVDSADADRFGVLFGSRAIDEVVYYGRPVFPEGQLRDDPDPATVVRGQPREAAAGGSVRAAARDLRLAFDHGKTVLLHSLQLEVPEIATLARGLEVALQCPVNVNMYLTPPGAQGFGVHFDDHDVFVLQLEGTKTWRIRPPTHPLPLRHETTIVGEVGEDLLSEDVELAPGHLLYLPRGFLHEAFTAQTASLHLTFGLDVFRWADLLAQTVGQLSRNNPSLREALPVGWLDDEQVRRSMDTPFRKLLTALIDQTDLDRSLLRLGREFVGSLRRLPDGAFGPVFDPGQVAADTLLRRRPGLALVVGVEGDRAVLYGPDTSVAGPAVVEPALAWVAAHGDSFCPRDLPGALSTQSKVVLTRQLLREQIVDSVATGSNG